MTSAEQIRVIREAAYAARAVLNDATLVCRATGMAYSSDLHPRFRDATLALEALLAHPLEPGTWPAMTDASTTAILEAIAATTGIPVDVLVADPPGEGAFTRAQQGSPATITRWRTELDERTCEPCRARHGEPAGIGYAGHHPPPHPDCENPDGCRCTLERD